MINTSMLIDIEIDADRQIIEDREEEMNRLMDGSICDGDMDKK